MLFRSRLWRNGRVIATTRARANGRFKFRVVNPRRYKDYQAQLVATPRYPGATSRWWLR